MVDVTVKHATLTGAAPDTNALVDGPAWDADHTVVGLDNVASTDEVNTWTAAQSYSGTITINAVSGEALQIGGNSGRFYFWPSGNTPIQFLNSSGVGTGYRFYQTDSQTSIYDAGVGRFHVGLIGTGTVSASPDGTNTSWAVSATDNMQMPHDNIILARAADGHSPGLTFKTTDILGGFDKPYGNIGVNTADANKFRVSSGPTAANIPANNSLILSTYNGATEMDRVSIPGGAGAVLISFPNFTSLGVQGFVGAGNSSTSPSQLFHGLAAAAGSVSASLQLDANNTTSGETHTAKFSSSDNGAGTIRALVQAPGTLNAGSANQGRFDMTVEDGSIFMMRVTSTAASGGSTISLFDRTGSGTSKVTIQAAGTSTFAGGSFGYGTGVGGAVTQATNKSTGVTRNKQCGAITMNNAALAADTTVSFVLTNSAIAATDVLILNHMSGGTPGSYLLHGRAAAGSATIDVRNITGGSLSETIVIQFALIKAVTA